MSTTTVIVTRTAAPVTVTTTAAPVTVTITAGSITVTTTAEPRTVTTTAEPRTVTTTTTVSGTSPPCGNNHSYSPAEVGGISLGAALGGILLALAAIFCFLRFKRRPRNRSVPAAALVPASAVTAVSHEYSVLDHLPQQVADQAIKQKMDKLCTDIKNCVDSFLSNQKVRFEASYETNFQDLAGPPVGFSSWYIALSNNDTRVRALRLLMAQILFAHIDLRHGTPETTLFPPHLLSVYQGLNKGQETMRGSRVPDSFERKEILSIWRQICGYFLPEDSLSHQARLRADAIAIALAPIFPGPHERFIRILDDLVHDTGRLGLELFKSPDEWKPLWTSVRQGDNGGILVFPGLEALRSNHSDRDYGGTEGKMKVCSAIVIH